MKKDQKTLLYEALSKMAVMSGDSFMSISEMTRRRIAKGLIYEDVSLSCFDEIRDQVILEKQWDHTNFNTKEEINAELDRLEQGKQRDLPSMAYEVIDKQIEILRGKLKDLPENDLNEGLFDLLRKRKKKKMTDAEAEQEYENKINARRNLRLAESVYFDDVCGLLESILDPINKTRCLDIFDRNDNMLPNVRKFIMDIVEKFKEHVNFPLNIRNIYMIGSSTGYQYSLTSDIDIEIELGIEEKQMWDIIPIVPKGTLLPGTQKPLNIFILCKDETYDFDKAENVYDIVRNKWAKKTGKKDLEIPYQYIRDLSTFFMNGCDLAISNYEKDIRELDEYIALDPETQEISIKEKFEAIDRKLIDVKNDVDQLKMAHHVIFAFENEGYDGNPFKISIQGIKDPDPRYSINNLVYKMLDKHGYNEKMLSIVKTGRSKIKEVEKYISENKDKSLQEARKTYYHTCPDCGANLDPGETCNCKQNKADVEQRTSKNIVSIKKDDSPKKHSEKPQNATVTKKPGNVSGQLEFTFESINVKKEYDGKSLEVELDADLDLDDGKQHHIKSKNLELILTKKDGKLDLEVDIETDIKEKNDENIEKYNKKLKSDMAAAKEAGVPSDIVGILYDALAELSDKQIGALIAIENKQNLDKYCENGTTMNCPISRDIFMSIFYPGTEVHDGATIIKDGVIKYSSVFFKNISGDDFAEHYGARHRAAMGLSKETDAFCIVVSEESGNISFAVDGKLEVIKADDVKNSRDRFIKLYNENKTNKTVSESISEALLLKEQSKAFGLTTKKEDLPDVQTGEAFKVTFYDNGEYVGEVSVSDDYDGDKLCFAYNIEVKKELRGQGYGTKIMKHMIDKYHIKSLQVAPDNDVAIHLYKKLGFKKTGEVRMSKTRVDDRMELPSKKRLEPYND